MQKHFYIPVENESNNSILSCYEEDIVTTVFERYLPEVSASVNRPYIMNIESYPKLLDIVKEKDFFMFWASSKERRINDIFADEDTPDWEYDHENFSFELPLDNIHNYSKIWFVDQGKEYSDEQIKAFYQNVISKKVSYHHVNEYYGDSTDYHYVQFDKQELLEKMHDFVNKPVDKVVKKHSSGLHKAY